MTEAPISLQDLRRRIYVRAKADFGWKRWSMARLHEWLGVSNDSRAPYRRRV
jgi:hypothetical protein